MSLSLEQQKIAIEFPEATWSIADRLWVFRPAGTLTAGMVAKLIQWLQVIETDRVEPFHRFTDLTQLHAIGVSRLDVANVAFWRRTTYSGPPIKSAFLAESEESLALAGAYAAFMKGTPILISVFRILHEAAAWLGVSAQSLGEAKSSD